MNPNRPTPRHIIIKMAKVKDIERILMAARENTELIIRKPPPIKVSVDVPTKPLEARREWQDIFKVLKGRNLQSRILYPARISFKYRRRSREFLQQTKTKRVQQY